MPLCRLLFVAALVVAAPLAAQPYALDAEDVLMPGTDPSTAPAVDVDGDGNYVVIFGSPLVARRFDPTGAPRDAGEIAIGAVAPRAGFGPPAVAVEPGGAFVVAAPQVSGEVTFRRFGADGAALDGAFMVANSYTTGTQSRPDVASDAAGNFVVVWSSPGSVTALPGDPLDTSLGSIQARRYRADGTPIDAQEIQVNDYTTGAQSRPAVAMFPDGGFVVVWEMVDSFQHIAGRRFDSAGQPSFGQFIVDSHTGGAGSIVRDPRVATDTRGRFVVSWSDGPSVSSDIAARQFDENAAGVAPHFGVSTYNTGLQFYSDVASDSEGNFVVSWMSYVSPGTDTDLSSTQARRYRWDGPPREGQFQVNTYTTSPGAFAQLHASTGVGMSPNGDFVVAFYSDDPDGGGGYLVHARTRRFGRPTITVTTDSSGSDVDECTLRDAILAAASGAAVAQCPAGNGGANIDLPAAVDIHMGTIEAGSTALPLVDEPITVLGHGGTIRRQTAADPGCTGGDPDFRLFDVARGGILELVELTVADGCLPADPGGAIRNDGALVLRGATLRGNRAAAGGGAISTSGSLLARDTTFQGNVNTLRGGAIAITGLGAPKWIDLRRITVSGNSAPSGGGLQIGGRVVLRDSTLSGNSATTRGGGWSVVGGASTFAALDFVTVTANDAPFGAGLDLQSGTTSLHDTLVGDNSGFGADCNVEMAANLATSGVNLDTDGSCGVTQVPSLGLAALAANGGATRTHLANLGSPARDGAPACLDRNGQAALTDQRGVTRPTDDDGDDVAACDLGATERDTVFYDGFEVLQSLPGRWSSSVP